VVCALAGGSSVVCALVGGSSVVCALVGGSSVICVLVGGSREFRRSACAVAALRSLVGGATAVRAPFD
jgi:hypothetical protein